MRVRWAHSKLSYRNRMSRRWHDPGDGGRWQQVTFATDVAGPAAPEMARQCVTSAASRFREVAGGQGRAARLVPSAPRRPPWSRLPPRTPSEAETDAGGAAAADTSVRVRTALRDRSGRRRENPSGCRLRCHGRPTDWWNRITSRIPSSTGVTGTARRRAVPRTATRTPRTRQVRPRRGAGSDGNGWLIAVGNPGCGAFALYDRRRKRPPLVEGGLLNDRSGASPEPNEGAESRSSDGRSSRVGRNNSRLTIVNIRQVPTAGCGSPQVRGRTFHARTASC